MSLPLRFVLTALLLLLLAQHHIIPANSQSSSSASASSSLSSSTSSIDISSLFVNVTDANLTDSLDRVRYVPFKVYEYKYDSVQGRRSLGVMGPDALVWFPDSVEVVPQYPLPNKDRNKKTVVLQNFPVVDKNVIFMHGIAAMQALVLQLSSVTSNMAVLNDSLQGMLAIVDTLETAMNASMSEQLSEKLRLSELELQVANKTGELSKLEMEYLQREALDKALEVKELLDYESVLVKSRMAREEVLARELMDRKVALESTLIEKRDRLRRDAQLLIKAKETENLQKRDIRTLELEKEKISAEGELQARNQRESDELALKQMELQAKLDSERVVKTVKSIAIQIKGLVSSILRNPSQVAVLCSIAVGLMAAFYVLKLMVEGLRSFIQARLGRPMLVRETSMESVVNAWLNRTLSFFRKEETLAEGTKHIEEYFKDVILTPEDKSRVAEIALATRNTKASGVPYRHVLLHGPPGTGKTLIARKLAQCSGMDYAILSGGDVGPLGEDAVNQLHALFAWASKSRKGLLVFIDEAEAFLASRSGSGSSGSSSSGGDKGGGGGGGGGGASEVHLRHALNALLYQTGTQSTSFMLVIATNRPQDLDPAVLDRIDMTLLIDLPKVKERSLLVKLYLDLHIKSEVMNENISTNTSGNNNAISNSNSSKKDSKKVVGWFGGIGGKARTYRVDDSCYSADFIDSVSKKIDGFSGREVSKLFISAQYAMLMSEDGALTQALLDKVLTTKLSEHAQRQRFHSRSL